MSPVSTQKPRVFISYRYEDDEHTAWVQRFVRHLEKRVVNVVFDRYLDDRRKEVNGSPATYSARDGYITRLVHRMNFCHVFMPIFTPEYLEGIGYPGGKPAKHSFAIGWVFDEFQLSCELGAMRRIETIAVLRRGDPDKLPPGFHAGNILDLRSAENYEAKLDVLGYYLHEKRVVARVGELQAYEDFWDGEI